MVNVLCSPGVWARHRKLAQTAPALLVRGQVQNASGAVTVVAERMGAHHPGGRLEVARLPVSRRAPSVKPRRQKRRNVAWYSFALGENE